MTRLFVATIQTFLEPSGEFLQEAFEIKKGCLSEERIARITKIKNPADKARSLAAGLILYKGYRLITGEETLPSIKHGAQGKPYFEDKEALLFNLSHSGDYVAVGFSSNNIGVDVQQERRISEAFQKRVYSEKEKRLVEERKADYITYYARKEAFVKYTGEGMKRDFAQIDVSNEWMIEKNKRVHLKSFYELPGYALAVAGEEILQDVTVERIEF